MHRLVLPLTLLAVTASAQFQDNRDQQLNCDSNNFNGRRARSCSMQEQTIGGTGSLEVGPTHNGSISVKGWNQNTVLVRARLETWAATDARAEEVARQVRLEVTAGRVRVVGPDNDSFRDFFRNNDAGWSMSFEVFAPHDTNLNLNTHNGGVTISDVRGRIAFETHNGAAKLTRVAGDVSGNTHNGAVTVELAGNSFDGQQLDVETHNGAVTLSMPGNYSARVETETHNGSVETDFPITVTGRLGGDRRDRNLAFNVGSGGSPIRVRTHNGGIRVRRI